MTQCCSDGQPHIYSTQKDESRAGPRLGTATYCPQGDSLPCPRICLASTPHTQTWWARAPLPDSLVYIHSRNQLSLSLIRRIQGKTFLPGSLNIATLLSVVPSGRPKAHVYSTQFTSDIFTCLGLPR